MKQPQLSQTMLLEVLTKQIESLKNSSKLIQDVYPKVAQQLAQLDELTKSRKIPVDLKPLQEEHHRLKQTLNANRNNMTLPKWGWIGILGIIAVMLIAVSTSVWFYRDRESFQNEAAYWKQQHQQLKEKYEPVQP